MRHIESTLPVGKYRLWLLVIALASAACAKDKATTNPGSQQQSFHLAEPAPELRCSGGNDPTALERVLKNQDEESPWSNIFRLRFRETASAIPAAWSRTFVDEGGAIILTHNIKTLCQTRDNVAGCWHRDASGRPIMALSTFGAEDSTQAISQNFLPLFADFWLDENLSHDTDFENLLFTLIASVKKTYPNFVSKGSDAPTTVFEAYAQSMLCTELSRRELAVTEPEAYKIVRTMVDISWAKPSASFSIVGSLVNHIVRPKASQPVIPGHIAEWDSEEIQRAKFSPLRGLAYTGTPRMVADDAHAVLMAPELNILVHGTFVSSLTMLGGHWPHPTSRSYAAIEAAGGKNVTFIWSGRNSTSERHLAGRVLGQNLFDLALKRKVINLWGHSHGGNVIGDALQEFDRLASEFEARGGYRLSIKNIVTLATPFRPDHELPGERFHGALARVSRYSTIGGSRDGIVPIGGTMEQVITRAMTPIDYRADDRILITGATHRTIYGERRISMIQSLLGN